MKISKKLMVINAVGLTEKLIAEDTPNLWALKQQWKRPLIAPYPAVTTTSQSTLLTGLSPQEHGIVANGWYFRDQAQVLLWRQNNQLVEGEKIWESLRKIDPDFTCGKMFWWYNMYSSADFSVTPRPIYRADGAKLPEAYSYPMALNDELREKLGTFPLFKFWGPMTSAESTRWITDASIYTTEKYQPNLNLIYLPHLDYNLQRLGPNHPAIRKDMIELDDEIGKLLTCAEQNGYEVIVLSEYGIQPVDQPIHINRFLRKKGFITVRVECGEEHFDAGASQAFALADHQIAHVYVNEPGLIDSLKEELKQQPGIAAVYSGAERATIGLDHPRSGEIICLAQKNAWFTYYYWLDDKKAPDYARAVDIHRKPGYDPVELFMKPGGKLSAAWTLLKKKLGFRYLMQVIPLDANLVKGSHGVPCETLEEGPVMLSTINFGDQVSNQLNMMEFKPLLENWFQTH